MIISTRKLIIKSDIEHVFYCFSNIDYIHEKLLTINKTKKLTIIKHNNKLDFINNEILFTLSELDFEENKYINLQLTPVAKHLNRFGAGLITCTFTEHNQETHVFTQLVSTKTPNIIWRIVIKALTRLFIWQTKKTENEFIKSIENST